MRVALLFFFLLHSKWWRKQKLTRMHSWIRINRLFHFMQLKTSLEFFSLQKLAIKLIRNIWVPTKYTSLLLISCDVVVLTSKKKKTNITTEIKKKWNEIHCSFPSVEWIILFTLKCYNYATSWHTRIHIPIHFRPRFILSPFRFDYKRLFFAQFIRCIFNDN